MAKQWMHAQQDLFKEPPPVMRLRPAERTKAVAQLQALLMEALTAVANQSEAGDDQDHG
jgi:hypothetical protein